MIQYNTIALETHVIYMSICTHVRTQAPSLPEFADEFLAERARMLRLRLATAKARGGRGVGGRGKGGGGPGLVVSRIMELLDVEEEDDVPLPGSRACVRVCACAREMACNFMRERWFSES